MTPRQARRERREAERKAKKAELKHLKAMSLELAPELPVGPKHPVEFDARRAEINRRNAQHSTGPKTATGKLASSRNSLKHGLASGELIIPGEDRSAYEALLRDLLEERQPANPTEELLVQEMAQSWWLAQRAIRLQNECFSAEGLNEKRLALFLRYQTTYDRAFHKALTTLMRLQKERRNSEHGFVSQNSEHPVAQRLVAAVPALMPAAAFNAMPSGPHLNPQLS